MTLRAARGGRKSQYGGGGGGMTSRPRDGALASRDQSIRVLDVCYGSIAWGRPENVELAPEVAHSFFFFFSALPLLISFMFAEHTQVVCLRPQSRQECRTRQHCRICGI